MRVDILDLGLIVEAENFRASAELREQLPQATRQQRVEWLQAAIDAAYGTGAINQRGVGTPAARNKRLATSLSMASALPKASLPV